MNIPLSQFEQLIDPVILKRGFAYFNKGAVMDVEMISSGSWKASVRGNEDYEVILNLKNNVVISHDCDCPFDMGPICKHIVAVIFHLHQELVTLDISEIPKVKKPKIISSLTEARTILKKLHAEELTSFIDEILKKDKIVRQTFLSKFAQSSDDHTIDYYRKRISNNLKSITDRDGWISWKNVKNIHDLNQPFLDLAQDFFDQKKYSSSLNVSIAVLEEFTLALDFTDDSNGDVGFFIDEATEILDQLSETTLPSTVRAEFFNYCIEAYTKKTYSGWDSHLWMLELGLSLSKSEEEGDIILECLKGQSENQYYLESKQILTINVLKKHKEPTKVTAYKNEHLANPRIREQELKDAYDVKDFKKAIALAKDGIKLSADKKIGLTLRWYDWLLKIAQQQNDEEKIIEYAQLLYINSNNSLNYYKILKQTIKKENWENYREAFIDKIKRKLHGWNVQSKLNEIYIEDKLWEKLLDNLKQYPSLQSIEHLEKYLKKDYSSQLIVLYDNQIKLFVENNVGRSHYKRACKYLRRMKKLGGQEHVLKTISVLETKYPQRRALLDELGAV